MREYGAASAPESATRCQPNGLLAASASTRVSQNQRSPSRQSTNIFLIKNESVSSSIAEACFRVKADTLALAI